jgi:hypothetical protein
MGAAPFVAGVMWDLTGTYMAPLLMSLSFSLIALLSAVLLPSPKVPLLPDWERSLPENLPASSS